MPDPVPPASLANESQFDLPRPAVGPVVPPGFRYYATAPDVVDGVAVGLFLKATTRGPSIWDTLPLYLKSRRLAEFEGLSTSDRYRYHIVRRVDARWPRGPEIVQALAGVLASRSGVPSQTVELQELSSEALGKAWPNLGDSVAQLISKHIASLIADHTTVGVYRNAAELIDESGLAGELLRQARIGGLTPEEQELYRRAAEYYLDRAIERSKEQEGSASASIANIRRNLASDGPPETSLRAAMDEATVQLGELLESASGAIFQQADAALREAGVFARSLQASTYKKEDADGFLRMLEDYETAVRVDGPGSERARALRHQLERLERDTLEAFETVQQALTSTSDGVALVARVLVAFDPEHADRYARAARAAQAGLRAASAIHQLTSRVLPFTFAAGQWVALGAASLDLFLTFSDDWTDADQLVFEQIGALSTQIDQLRSQLVARLAAIEETLGFHFRSFMAQFARIHYEQAAAAQGIAVVLARSREVQRQLDRILGFVTELDLQADRREIDDLVARVRKHHANHVVLRLYTELSADARLEKYLDAMGDFLAILLDESSRPGLAGKNGQRLADILPKIEAFGLDFYINNVATEARGDAPGPRLINAVVWSETLACWLAVEAAYPDLPNARRLKEMPQAVAQLSTQLDDLADFVREVQSRPVLLDEAIDAYRRALADVFDELDSLAAILAERAMRRDTCKVIAGVLAEQLPEDVQVSNWARWLRESDALPASRLDSDSLDRLDFDLRQRLLDLEVDVPVRPEKGDTHSPVQVIGFMGPLSPWPFDGELRALHRAWVATLGSGRHLRGIYGRVPDICWEWSAATDKRFGVHIAPNSIGFGSFQSPERLNYFGLTPFTANAQVGNATVVISFGPTISGPTRYPMIIFEENLQVEYAADDEFAWEFDAGYRRVRIDSVQAAAGRPTAPRSADEYTFSREWVDFLPLAPPGGAAEAIAALSRELAAVVTAVELLAADGLGSRRLRRAASLASLAGGSNGSWYLGLSRYVRALDATSAEPGLGQLVGHLDEPLGRLVARVIGRLAGGPNPRADAVRALGAARVLAESLARKVGRIDGWVQTPLATSPDEAPTLLGAMARLSDLLAFCRLAGAAIERLRVDEIETRALPASVQTRAANQVAAWRAERRRAAEADALLALREGTSADEQRRLQERVIALEQARKHIEIWTQICFSRSAASHPALVRSFAGPTQLWGLEVMSSVCHDATVDASGALITDFEARRRLATRRVFELEDVLAELEAGAPEPYLPLALGRRLLTDHTGPGPQASPPQE